MDKLYKLLHVGQSNCCHSHTLDLCVPWTCELHFTRTLYMYNEAGPES